MDDRRTSTQYTSRTIRALCCMRSEFQMTDSQTLDAPSNFPQGSHLNMTDNFVTVNTDTSREMTAAWDGVFGF